MKRAPLRDVPSIAVWVVWAIVALSAARHLAATARSISIADPWLVRSALRPEASWWIRAFDFPAGSYGPLAGWTSATLFAATGDARASRWMSFLLLAGLAAGLVWSARRLRGRTHLTDAVFPLALLQGALSPMHGSPALGSVLSMTLFFAVWMALLRVDERRSPRWIAALVAGLVLLALTGGAGIVLCIPLALALGAPGLAAIRSPGPDRREALRVWVPVAATVALAVSLPFWGHPHPDFTRSIEPAPGRMAVRIVASVLGPGARPLQPFAGAVVVALAVALGVLGARALRRPGESARARVMLAGLVGVALLFIAAAFATPDRTVLLDTPLGALFPCAAGVSLAALSPTAASRSCRLTVFSLVCAAFALNQAIGRSRATEARDAADGFAQAAWIGVTPSTLAAEWSRLDPGDETPFEARVEALHAARFPPFDLSQEERDLRLRPFYRSLNGLRTTPDRIRSEGLVDGSRCDGANAVLVHAPSLVRYRVRRGAWRLAGRFGICPGAYSDGGATDGVRFRVFLPGNESPAFDRRLTPVEQAADRGPQPLELTFEVADAGEVVLQAGSIGTSNWDWSYWAGVSIRRERLAR